MAAASLIGSLLTDVELQERFLCIVSERFHDEINCQNEKGYLHEINTMKLDLRFMKTFLRCARKWSRESCLKKDQNGMRRPTALSYSQFSQEDDWYEDFYRLNSRVDFWDSSKLDVRENSELDSAVSQFRSKSQRFQDFSDSSIKFWDGSKLNGGEDSELDCALSLCRSKFKRFQEELNRLYIPSWYSCSLLSSTPVREELIENMDLLVQNLADILSWGKAYGQDLKEQIEGLEENLKFLKNLISFASFCGVEQRQLVDLLTHAEIIVVNAASLCYVFWFNRGDEIVCNDMQYKISGLLQKIKPIDDPQVYETYIQVMTASNLSGSLPNLSLDSNKHIVINFIDSLLGSVWELLNSSATFMKSVKVQMQMLYKELRFLRTILKEEEFHKVHETIKDSIGTVVNEAGIIVFSLFLIRIKEELVEETVFTLSNLLKKIKQVKAEVPEKYPVTSPFHFPMTDGLCFIDLLTENLKELECCEVDLIGFPKHQIQSLRGDLSFLRSFLEKIEEQQIQHENLLRLSDGAIEVAYKVESAISSLMVEDIPTDFCMSFDAITEEIKLIKTEILEIYNSKEHDIIDMKVQEVIRTSIQLQSQGSITSTNEVVVGTNDEVQAIIDKLTRGSKQLEIVSIVGMPGIGKTTLAKRVYSNISIMCHFHLRAWCYVSQTYCKRDLFLNILDGIASALPDRYLETSEDELAEELYRHLRRNKYLIVLDDLWDIEAWNNLKSSFPNDVNGSRILFTSRIQDVASEVQSDSKPHMLRRLTDDESWELLKQKLFGQEPCPQTVSVLGMRIAKSCQGLPLTVVVVAGILATIEQDAWGKVAESLSLDIICGKTQCMNSLELSYKHLPYYLKPCLLYFGAFPRGREISIWKLMSLWIAEGFVQKKELTSSELELVAEKYVMDLIQRSLVIVSKQRSTGGVKTCRVHDLLYEFCVAKAKKEKFLKFLYGFDELSNFDEPSNLRRLCIHSEPEHFVKSRLFCTQVRCLLFFADHHGLLQNWYSISFLFRFFRLLTVLDISEINLGDSFPRETELLVWLRYLAVRGKMKSVPSSIANLSKLETFIVVGLYDNVLLPNTIWNMKNLRHLRMTGCSFAFVLPNDNLEDSSRLYDLHTLSTAFLSFGQSASMENVMKKFPHIQKLKCIIRCRIRESSSINLAAMGNLSRLKSFNVSLIGASRYPFEIDFPSNLKKLTLSNYYQPWSKISTIGKLPNLEVLKLLNKAFEGEIWNMEKGEFPKLRILKLESLVLVSWRGTSDDNLPCLEKLLLKSCGLLQELPSCLKYSPTLEMIEVRWCHSSLVSLVRDIEQEQMDMGNEGLKIQVDQR